MKKVICLTSLLLCCNLFAACTQGKNQETTPETTMATIVEIKEPITTSSPAEMTEETLYASIIEEITVPSTEQPAEIIVESIPKDTTTVKQSKPVETNPPATTVPAVEQPSEMYTEPTQPQMTAPATEPAIMENETAVPTQTQMPDLSNDAGEF